MNTIASFTTDDKGNYNGVQYNLAFIMLFATNCVQLSKNGQLLAPQEMTAEQT